MHAAALLEAYLATPYRVRWADGERTLRIGVAPEPPLVSPLAIISAWNPRSLPRAALANEAAHVALGAELAALGCTVLAAENGAAGSAWLEASWCVIDPPWPAVDALARLYGQNAVVACAAAAAPRLRCYRPEWRALVADTAVDTRLIDWIA